MNASANAIASLSMAVSSITVSQSQYKGVSCFFSTRMPARSSFCLLSMISAETSDSKQIMTRFFGNEATYKTDHTKKTFKTVVRVNSSSEKDLKTKKTNSYRPNSSSEKDLKTKKTNSYRPKITREKNPIRLSSSASPRIVLDTYEIIRYPVITEKTMREMTKKNTLVFVVDKDANKNNIKEAALKMFGIETKKVNTLITFDGQKKAFLMLKSNFNALKIAKDIKALI